MVRLTATQIADSVIDTRVGPCRLILLPYESDGVVTFSGSVASRPDIAAGEDMVADLVNAMLDKGTRARDQYRIAAALESAGAERSYYGGVVRTRFAGRCLRRAIPVLTEVFAEELRRPQFDQRQFDLLKSRTEGRLRQSLQRTGLLAGDALSRHWFDYGHPNYAREIVTDLSLLADMSVEDVRSLHATHYGSDEMLMVVVGDLTPDEVLAAVGAGFDGWQFATVASDHLTQSRSAAALRREHIHVPDRPSIDVVMGHAVPITRRHDDFLPLMVGTFILGGNFSSRLMQKVRDEMGLTYGIRSNLAGVSVFYDMLWNVHVTLSQDTLEAGIDVVRSQVTELVASGVSEAEVARARETIAGAYLVSQDASASLAQTILVNTERGYPIRQLADYPREVLAVGVKQVNEVLRRHIRPDAVSIAVAGSLER